MLIIDYIIELEIIDIIEDIRLYNLELLEFTWPKTKISRTKKGKVTTF